MHKASHLFNRARYVFNKARYVFGPILALAATLGTPLAQAAEFPQKPVRIIVGYAPGGPLDSVARAVATKMFPGGPPVIIENRPGASGLIASQAVARAEPDGYTLMLVGVTHAILPAMGNPLPYDTLKDFSAISIVGRGPLLLTVNNDVPAKTVAELVALARAQPDRIAYASAGRGTSLHLAVELLKRATGVQMLHVPYPGSSPALTDLMGGRVQMMMDVVPSILPHVKAGKLRALAITGDKRLDALPDVPTIAQAGFPDADLTTWWGILGPAGVPMDVQEKLSREIAKSLQDESVRKRLAELGGVGVGSTPAEFDQVLRQDIARFQELVKAAGILENQ